jgi:hypothetical protein
MKGYLLLNNKQLGVVDFTLRDESMGAIGGELMPYASYNTIRKKVQCICEAKGVANIEDFPFYIQFDSGKLIVPQGGIGVTDIAGVDEIYVEAAGLEHELIGRVFRV